MLIAGAAALLAPGAAAAHVVPATTIQLDVHDSDIAATLTLPVGDLATASGIEVPEGATALSDSMADEIARYVEDHFAVVSSTGAPWSVDVGELEATTTEQSGTGVFPAVTAVATLVPPDRSELRSFTLEYDVIIHRVVTADILVILRSDWAAGETDSARALGAVATDTVSGTVPSLDIDLDDSSWWQGFVGMLRFGVSHIAEGTDHQLFLLTLLLPAPLIATGRRWTGVSTLRSAIGKITAITAAFSIGHTFTLALGVLGLPVPQQPVEALIAASILVAAIHAVRPIFPGKEALVAALFGLVHGMAFSVTLSSLDLSGRQLALSLLGFNLGVEIMQLAVVALVLPALVILARTKAYGSLRIAAATLTGVAAIGWVLDRLGVSSSAGAAADSLGAASPWILAALWLCAIAAGARMILAFGRERHHPTESIETGVSEMEPTEQLETALLDADSVLSG